MFYHISFKEDLAGIWTPRLPVGSELEASQDAKYSEPNIPRISLAPSIEKCFTSIYPNVSQFFEEKRYPYMDFFVYTPKDKLNKNDFTSAKELTEKRYVWDAHVTKEIWVTKPIELLLINKVRIFNPGKNAPFQLVKPFGLTSEEALPLAPKDINVRLLHIFPISRPLNW